MRRLFSFLVVCMHFTAISQAIDMEGKLVVETGDLSDAEITWKATRSPAKLAMKKDGKFGFAMDHNEMYVFTFTHPGCETYIIEFNTSASNDFLEDAPIPFFMEIYLPAGNPKTKKKYQIQFSDKHNEYAFVQPEMKTIIMQKNKITEEREAVANAQNEDTVTANPAYVDTVVATVDSVEKVRILADLHALYNIVTFSSDTVRLQTMQAAEKAAFANGNYVILKKYDEIEILSAENYGFINFGNGTGNIEVTREEFIYYEKRFNK